MYIVSVYFSPNSYSMHVSQQVSTSPNRNPSGTPGPIGSVSSPKLSCCDPNHPTDRNSHWGFPFGVYPKHIITKFQKHITKLAFKNFKQLRLSSWSQNQTRSWSVWTLQNLGYKSGVSKQKSDIYIDQPAILDTSGSAHHTITITLEKIESVTYIH